MVRSDDPAGQRPNPRSTQPRTTKKQKSKTVASSSRPQDDYSYTAEAPQRTIAPWPREDERPFTEGIPPLPKNVTVTELKQLTRYQTRRDGDPWDMFNSICYNGWLRIEMVPAKIVCGQTLERMGILDDVQMMLERMGLGTLPYKSYPLYPELARQFLSSVELSYTDTAHPGASSGVLSYFSRGVQYEISIPELCTLYGFDDTRSSITWPDDFTTPLWNLIGSRPCHPRETKLTWIRNPAVRVVAKILGHTLFGKEEAGSLTAAEMILLHYGLPRFVEEIYNRPLQPGLRTNLGVAFAKMLVGKRHRGVNIANAKKEYIGSLLTPIFLFNEIDLSAETCVQGVELFNERYFRSATILKPDFIYSFSDRDGRPLFCKLPIPEYSSLTSPRNLEFTPPTDLLCAAPSAAPSKRRAVRSSSPPAQQDAPPQPHYQRSYQQPDVEPVLPAYSGEYDLSELPADATIEDRLDCILANQRASHSMMRKIWDGLSRLTCPRPPSCFGGGEPSRARTTDTTADGDDAVPDERLPRRRRVPGQRDSISPEDRF